MKKVLFSSLFILAFSSLCFAQNTKIDQRITGLWINSDDDCWTDPCEITVSGNSRMIIVVNTFDEDNIGTFAIAYSTSLKQP